MRTRPPAHRIPALVMVGLLLVATACSGSDEATTVTEAVPTDTVSTEATSTTGAADTTAPPAVETTQGDTGETAPDGPAQIDVMIGVDSGPDRVEHVAVGADVTLNIINGPVAAEYHVHGIDLEVAAEADQTVTLQFVADVAGPYEVEDHETGEVILVIEVDE